MLTEQKNNVCASAAHATSQSTALMQRSFMPEIHEIGFGQLHSG
jgi:hypothetical protein